MKQKYTDYYELVKAVRNEYLNNPDAHKQGRGEKEVKLGWTDYCEEINLYTYWQGLNYEKNKPQIKYMLVAQDWGNPDKVKKDNVDFFKRIEKINQGNTDVQYVLEQDLSGAPTDKNLVRLFDILGYKDITSSKRYADLFFTNFCLGYRAGNESGNMGKRLMMMDKEYFYSLCCILKPEKILCLGKLTFSCVFETLSEKRVSSIDGYGKDYNDFIGMHKPIQVSYEGIMSKVYALAHCGTMGTLNRNKIRDKSGKLVTDQSISELLQRQVEDWEAVRDS